MKVETHIPPEFIEAIATEVFGRLKPVIAGMTSKNEDPLFTPDQLAGYLGVKRQWVYERVSLGQIPHVKVGRYLRFRKSAIDNWLESKSVPDSSPYSQIGKLPRRLGAR